MCKIFAVTNWKGGCGKTTLAVNLAVGLAKRGKKVLLVDQSPQGDATSTLLPSDVEMKNNARSLYYGVLLVQCIYQSKAYGIDVVPSDMSLVDLDTDLFITKNNHLLLAKALNPDAVKDYDYVLIDSAPLLGLTVENSLYAAERLIIPVDGVYSIMALGKYNGIICNIAKVKPKLAIDSIVLTRVAANAVIYREIKDAAIEAFGENKVCKISIPDSIKFEEAAANRQSIYALAPKSYSAVQYMRLVDELLKKWEGVTT